MTLSVAISPNFSHFEMMSNTRQADLTFLSIFDAPQMISHLFPLFWWVRCCGKGYRTARLFPGRWEGRQVWAPKLKQSPHRFLFLIRHPVSYSGASQRAPFSHPKFLDAKCKRFFDRQLLQLCNRRSSVLRRSKLIRCLVIGDTILSGFSLSALRC